MQPLDSKGRDYEGSQREEKRIINRVVAGLVVSLVQICSAKS